MRTQGIATTIAAGIFAILSLMHFSSVGYGESNGNALPSGDEIAEQINARDEGRAVSRTVAMELIDRRGKKRLRLTRGFRKYYGDEKRTVIFFESPKNIKGTAFLTIDYPDADQDDDQWLYLPAMRKVRRISASNRGDYFLGTDFTYEDIKKESKVGIEDYTRKTLGEDTVDDHRCYQVEAIAINEKIAKELGYSRLLSWVDPNIWMVRKSEYWDVNGNLLKTTYIQDIRKIQGIWTAHRIEVRNHKTGHRTVFTFSDIDYKNGVNDDVFTERALRRGI